MRKEQQVNLRLRKPTLTMLTFIMGSLMVVFLAEICNSVLWATDGSSEVASQNDTPSPDNSPCFVCHANFEDEPLSMRHFKAKVGCIDCHGESLAHRSDENNTTPPDKMYPQDNIEPACKQCHKTHNAPAREVVEVYLKRCRDITDPAKLTCTNCHGKHRMYHRTILWDKRTGRLIPPSESSPQSSGQQP